MEQGRLAEPAEDYDDSNSHEDYDIDNDTLKIYVLKIYVFYINEFDGKKNYDKKQGQDDATGKTMGECWIFISSSLSRRQRWPHGYVTDTRTARSCGGRRAAAERESDRERDER